MKAISLAPNGHMIDFTANKHQDVGLAEVRIRHDNHPMALPEVSLQLPWYFKHVRNTNGEFSSLKSNSQVLNEPKSPGAAAPTCCAPLTPFEA
jgi:hypothetical protein